MTDAPPETPKSFRSIFGWVGAVVGAVSLFGFFESLFQFGLSQVAADCIAFYRNVIDGLTGWFFDLLPFKPPRWYLDVLALNAVACSATLRAVDVMSDPDISHVPLILKPIVFAYVFVFFFMLFGLTLMIPLFAFGALFLGPFFFWVTWMEERAKRYSGERGFIVDLSLLMYQTVLVLIVIFALNAYGVSVS